MPFNAGQILYLSTSLLTVAWWAQLWRHHSYLIGTAGKMSWALGFLLPLPFFAIPLSLARLGLLSDFSRRPPPFFVFLAFMFVLCYAVSRAPVVIALTSRWGYSGLVMFQGFRILPELAIAAGIRQGIAPAQLGLTGHNGDLIYAVFALILGFLMKWHPGRFATRGWATGAQVLGVLSLLNIFVIAVTSMPTPLQRYPPSQSNEWVTFEPYVLLPGFLVCAAIIGHLCLQPLLRQNGGGTNGGATQGGGTMAAPPA